MHFGDDCIIVWRAFFRSAGNSREFAINSLFCVGWLSKYAQQLNISIFDQSLGLCVYGVDLFDKIVNLHKIVC